MARLLQGKPVVEALASRLAPRIRACRDAGVVPTLALVRVGEDPSDLSYERTALKRAEALGVAVRPFALPGDASTSEVARLVEAINGDEGIHGCLLFRPLPPGIDDALVSNLLAPEKDVDGITAMALAGVFVAEPHGFPPSTAEACLQALDHYGIDVAGRHVTVAGRSLVVGRPVSMMLLERDATVTLCHSRTADLSRHTQAADIVICATGKPRFFGPECFRPGQVVLDVGINFDGTGRLCGDVDFDAVEPLIGDEGAITPVPGGLGTVTTSVTMAHVVQNAERGIHAHQHA